MFGDKERSGGEVMKKYDGWIIKNKWGSLLMWTMALTKYGVKRKVPNWKEWIKEGHKLVKIKLVEIKT